jgi:phage I-like protein
MLTGEDVPGRVVLAPWGRVESQKGVFFVDEESAEMVVRAFLEHATDLPIDYEHQTLGGEFASPDGRAPAAGWIKSLSAEPGVGIVGHIEWTPQGREMLASREYRYLSPVALIRKSDRKLVGIHSAALTNKPAIVAMEAIVNRTTVPDDGTQDEAATMCQLRAELQLADEASPCEVLAAAHQRLRELGEAMRVRRNEERIVEAMRSGKLTAGQRAWAEAMIAKDETLFEVWFKSAPVVVRPGTIAAPPLTDSERTRRGAETRARSEFRANRSLSGLTSEEAYVADAVRCA